jgi:hypothetical protein
MIVTENTGIYLPINKPTIKKKQVFISGYSYHDFSRIMRCMKKTYKKSHDKNHSLENQV